MHRIRVPLVLLVATLLIAGCAAQMPQPSVSGTAPSRMAPVCRESGAGERNPDAPIVCVDDSASVLRVSPDPFILHATPSKGSGTPAVQWFTTSGRGDLKVVFRDETCVRNVVCTGDHCTAVAARLEPGERERRCKYDVQLTGHPTLDPEGVLTPCCVPGGG
jgi:hypothetical protein